MFLNGQTLVPIRNNLIAMYHPQPENGNPLKSDSKTGVGIVRSFMKPKRSKYWDMKYHWLEDCTNMGYLNPYWERGIHNWEDYFTNHHPPAYHKIISYKYLQKFHLTKKSFCTSHSVRGCVNLSIHIHITL